MANKTNTTINGQKYFRITKTIGRKINENGVEVPVRKQFLGKNQKEAQQKYEAFMAHQSQGLIDSRQFFGITADDWIYNFFIHDGRVKDSTKQLYILHWNNYLRGTDLYHMPLNEVTASTIQNLYNSLEAPLSAIKSINKLMKKFYVYLEHEGYARNITSSLVVPKAPKTIDDEEEVIVTWTDEEIKKIMSGFDAADSRSRIRFLIILGYHTGARISELLAVRYSDISDSGMKISKQVISRATFNRGEKTSYTLDLDTPKSKSSYRTIPLNRIVREELKRHRKWHLKEMKENGYESDYIFTTKTGGFCDQRNISRACNRYYERIGVEQKGFHTYRHTFGTNLCRNGIPIQTTSVLLGHEDISVTAKYYVNVGLDQKQAAVDSLVELPA